MADKKFFNFHQLSAGEIHKIKYARWKARTDLQFLCNKILNYRDVNQEVHGKLIKHLQSFPEPNKEQFVINDDLSKGFINYKPVILLEDFVEQEKIKRRLILDFRSSLKTTINVMAHSIQWILNYPNISLLIIQSSIEKAEEILAGIKEHFQFNETFRTLFPEHVPQKKIYDWCTKGAMKTEAFDSNNLLLGMPHKEGTIITGGIDKGMAGKHLDILKFSDIIDPTNTKTDASCRESIKQFNLCQSLLTSPKYWIDVEGTRYSYADLYGHIIENEAKLDPERRIWAIYARGCYKKKTKDGSPQQFLPTELELPDLIDLEAKSKQNPEGKVSWWPKRFTPEDLESMRIASPYTFATQYYNSPRSSEEGMEPFPIIDGKYPVLMKREVFEKNVPKAYYEISVDTAETDHQKSNFTAISIGCWTGAGNLVVTDIVHGKFLPDRLIDKLYGAYIKYKPQNIKIEETSFTRGLMAGIRREGEKMGIYLPIQMIKRENQTAKQERIVNTLQPYYINGQLRFLDDISCMDQLMKELKEFPSGSQDDILDSLADFFQGKVYFGREKAREEDLMIESKDKATRLNQEYLRALPTMINALMDTGNFDKPNPYVSNTYSRTGGL